MKAGGPMPHSQGLPIISIMSQTNPIPSIDIYFFNIYSKILLPSTSRPS